MSRTKVLGICSLFFVSFASIIGAYLYRACNYIAHCLRCGINIDRERYLSGEMYFEYHEYVYWAETISRILAYMIFSYYLQKTSKGKNKFLILILLFLFILLTDLAIDWCGLRMDYFDYR